MLILIASDNGRLRAHLRHVGEDGILANTAYALDETGQLVRAASSAAEP